ncbi:LLM class flavin-dependent oxidoreductase [Burkholderia gladioli]|uniref:LLM class flavin-dependent oxidoreductase n=1 Tax=Burkholderia gladioli TaxID=28095 RepID=UPI001640DA69|nr:LLM class flavin-dependent oxidoreductase [Burkholderia gladioli]
MSATAAAEAGCAALLPSAGPDRPDPWIAAAVLREALPELALTIALQAGAILPVAAALCAQSLQSLRGGRLALAVERDAPGVDASRRGATLNRVQRRARRLEFLAILPTLWAGTGPLDHQGAWFRAEHARLAEMPVPRRQRWRRPPPTTCASPRSATARSPPRDPTRPCSRRSRASARRARCTAFGARAVPMRPQRGRRSARGPSPGRPPTNCCTASR